MTTPREKQALVQRLTKARVQDVEIAHVQPSMGMTMKDATESLKGFLAKQGGYMIVAVRV
jgi:hypothetical protein